jgi:hypothetical protein
MRSLTCFVLRAALRSTALARRVRQLGRQRQVESIEDTAHKRDRPLTTLQHLLQNSTLE